MIPVTNERPFLGLPFRSNARSWETWDVCPEHSFRMMVINDHDHNQCALLPINFAGDFAGVTFFTNRCYSFPQRYLAAKSSINNRETVRTSPSSAGFHQWVPIESLACLRCLRKLADGIPNKKLIKRIFSSLKILMDIMDSKFVMNFVGMMVAKSIWEL